jgi:DNA helicase-2/ATP-dependent DNA helicase PcrA
MNHSKYQINTFNFVKESKGNAIVQAAAGSGKTYTITKAMEHTTGNVLMTAFNKSIANELQSKVPSHVTVSTLHSLGMKMMYANKVGRIKVYTNKVDFIMNKLPATTYTKGMTREEWKDVNYKRTTIKSLVSLCKATITNPTDNAEVAKMADHYNIEYTSELMPLFRSIFQKSIDDVNNIDFDDMIYLPVIMGMKPKSKFDWIFIDECQDMNKAQIALVLSVKKEQGRIIAVGDRNQSIYGFRGADIEAMDRIKESLNANELPLSVCYRCPTSHIEHVKNNFPEMNIESHPDNKEGTIQHIQHKDFIENIKQDENKNPLILSRVNAPLVSYALSLLSNNIKAHIKGSDIGKNLMNILKHLDGETIEDTLIAIDNWEANEMEKLIKRYAPKSTQSSLIDKADTLRIFCENAKDKQNAIDNIERLYSDENKNDVTLSSVHKAKGLESDCVYIVRPDLMPLDFGEDMKDWEKEQENNIQYVALTRSKDKLVIVNYPKD